MKVPIKPHVREKLIKSLESMEPFTPIDNEWDLPPIPKLEKEDYEKYVIPNFIRCGAIPKKDLIVGREYDGDCRNAGRAKWLGDKFVYIRRKFGYSYEETINHFEDDDGFDLFVPMKLVENE